MPEKLTPIQNTGLAELRPAQVRLTAEMAIAPDLPIFGGGGPGISCICECFNGCICDCICDCICEFDEGITRLPVTATYEVVYELEGEATVDAGIQTTTQGRLVIGMEESVYNQLAEKEKLVEIGTSKTGAKQYLLKRPNARRKK